MDFGRRLLMYLLAGVFMTAGCAGGFNYERYSTKDSQIGIEIDYISGWVPLETRGSYGSYSELTFLEPVKKNKPLRSMMSVIVRSVDKIEPKPVTIEKFMEDIVGKRLKLKGAKLLGRSAMQLSGSNALVADFSYQLPANPESLDASYILMNEKLVVLSRGERCYTYRYVGTAEDFKVYLKAFLHCIDSQKFK